MTGATMRNRLPGCDRGVTTIEFAMLLPVLLTLICGAIDLGYFYMAQTSLNGAVLQAARASAASMEKSESDRNSAMRATILKTMSPYNSGDPAITTMVYHKFGDSSPEPYIDANNNGHYDPPQGASPGEAFTDRNGNGVWDASTPIATGAKTMGDVGDVVN
jgi:Flp pilus assembly protein TadG